MIKGMALVTLLAAAFAAAAQSANTAAQKAKADVIFIHGNIYTEVIDSAAAFGSGKRAESLAIAGDKILAVGTRDDVMKFKGTETKIIDLNGHFVMPGFNDAHMHMASAGLEKMNVNMVGAKTLDEFRDRLQATVEAAGPAQWLGG